MNFNSYGWCGWSQWNEQSNGSYWKLNDVNSPENHLTHFTEPMTRFDGSYIYLVSNNSNEASASIYSPVYEPKDRLVCFTFHYYIYGDIKGRLELFQVPENVDELLSDDKQLLRLSGNQGNKWHQGYVDLKQLNSNYQLVFLGIHGSSHLGSIGLDKFSLSQDKTNCKILRESIIDRNGHNKQGTQ